MIDNVAILDFGSQYAQLIARKLREQSIYCELFPWNAPKEQVLKIQPKGFILSGGPSSVYEPEAPYIPNYVLESKLPILGICYGMQALTYALGGIVQASASREYGKAELEIFSENPLMGTGKQFVWMSHGDRIERLPPGFISFAKSTHSPIAFMGDLKSRLLRIAVPPRGAPYPWWERNSEQLCDPSVRCQTRMDSQLYHHKQPRASSPSSGNRTCLICGQWRS